MDNITYTLAEVRELLIHGNRQRAYFIQGRPGLGKTSMVKQVAEHLGGSLLTIGLATKEPTDLTGMPMVVNGITTYVPWDWASMLTDPDGPPMVAFLDDMTVSMTQTMNASLDFLLERQVGGKKVRDNVLMIGAGNMLTDNTGAQEMPMAVANRFAGHYIVTADLECWLDWAVQEGINPLFIAYHRKTGGTRLDLFDPNNGAYAQATPRSWVFAAEQYERLTAAKVSQGLIQKAMTSCVGVGAGIDLFTFLEVGEKLIETEDIIGEPKKAKVHPGADMDLHWVQMAALESHVSRHPEHWKAGLIYALRTPAEIGVLYLARIHKVMKRLRAENKLDPATYAEMVTGPLMMEAQKQWMHLIPRTN